MSSGNTLPGENSVYTNDGLDAVVMLAKLRKLLIRIEKWCDRYGYEHMKNAKETWGKGKNKGILVWKQTDWECVDSMHNNLYNGTQYFSSTILKELNKIWNRYNITLPPKNSEK
jgi:hypothetical protein